MRTFSCQCGGVLFFQNTACVGCGASTALCCHCKEVCALEPVKDSTFRCRGCGGLVNQCQNNLLHQVCNGTVPDDSSVAICRFCSLTEVIPDLRVKGNLVLWRCLEMAKQRVLYQIGQLGLPITSRASQVEPKLRFEFKADGAEPVSTGHDNGLITINLAEADSVAREQTRVDFGEPQRTLVGHFRHELGHYYWGLLVKPSRLEGFRELFGDEREPTYTAAQRAYYDQRADVDWQGDYISKYATMHPWEDFAETFAAYLDMVAIVSTARDFDRVKVTADGSDFDAMVSAYSDVGIVANEFNRDMGLLDLVPEVFTALVINKLRFVHRLRCNDGVSDFVLAQQSHCNS